MSTETRKLHSIAARPAVVGPWRTLPLALIGLLGLWSMMGSGQVQPTPEQPVSSVQTDGRIIERIEFRGLISMDPIYLQGVAGIKAGAIWDRAAITEACRRLAATRKFEGTPYAEPREEGGNLILVFVVNERPFVTSIDFVGNQAFKTGDLLREIDLEVGSPISVFLTRQGRQQIEQKYREAGYAYVSVELDDAILRDEHRVLFRISEGPRVQVREIRFEGNTAFGDIRLQSQIETATWIWLFRTGAYDPETVERDAAAIKAFYVARGFLNARVGHRIDFEVDDETHLILTFQIEEGLQHIIETVEYAGNTVFDDSVLESMMQSTIGSIVDADILKADHDRLLMEYGRLGYLYVHVSLSHVFSETDGYIHLTVRIDEGDQYRVGRIQVRGNRHTRDNVIRRELRFFPEDLYDTEAVRKAEQRLVETRLFNEAHITPEGKTPGVREALVTVEEADTTMILFGIGVTSNSGVVGSISIEQRNFDIFDWPRTSKEFFSFRSFRGRGQTMRLSLEPGTELTRGRLEFREPYLFDREIGLGLGVYVFERGRQEYDERRIGFTTSFDKRWREGPLEGWAGEIAFRFENVNITGADPFTSREILEDEGDNWLTSVKGSIVHDRTDSFWLPSEGDRLKLSVEQVGALGGDHTFTKAMGTYDHYWTVKTDTFGRKHVLQLGATLGQIFGDAPVFEKFFAGGIGSIRGYEFRGISPRDGFRDDRVGGDFMLLANAQYSFPLVGKTMRGVTFLDMGTVEEEFGLRSWRASVGIGARIYVKYFGPIPLSFDFAFPIASEDVDDEQVFNFSFGTTF